MFRNFSLKLFIGCAIALQLSSLVHYSGLIATSGKKDVLLEKQQQQSQLQDSPQTMNANSKEDTVLAGDNKNNSSTFFQPSSAQRTDQPKAAETLDSKNTTNMTKLAKKEFAPKKLTTTTNSKSISNTTNSLSIRNECFEFNSDKWINGSISSNNDNGITPGLLDTLLEGPRHFRKLPSLFDQTICHEDSPLRNFSPQKYHRGMDRRASAEDWYQRFLYLALHWKFHRPALNEHRSRRRCAAKDAKDGASSMQSFMDQHKIKQLDFECRGEKFVVIPIGSIGFGAFLNTQASLSILLALRTNRIPIFSSKSFFPWQKRKGDQDPWLLAPSHCDRKDLQCYFLPLSPCTVTNEDLETAPLYGSNRKEQKFLAKNLTIPPTLESERIVVLNSGLADKSMDTPDMRQIASAVVDELLVEWKIAKNDENHLWSDEDLEAMELAHQWLTEKTKNDPIGLLRQVYVYMLRPNPHYKDLLERQMSALVPEPINASETIGIAVRGSDKCISESMCLPFDRYMELATDIAYPALSLSRNISSSSPPAANNRPKLIMTTEDPQVFNDSLAYQHNDSFPFEFLVNGNDNMQGSGYPKDFSSGEEEKTIVSSLMALKFHFNAGRVYLNCCSNFHLVLNYLLQGQCGARRHGHDFVFGNEDSILASPPPPVAQCLNEDGIPRRFRICCGWSKKRGICRDIWKEYLTEKEESNLLLKNKYGGVAISG
jgi:hypothetical protein